jgi:CPA1 family monovalent cation:H+ antiporter
MGLSQLLIVMIGAIAVTILAERRNVQPPLLLAFAGVLVSFVPGFGRLELEPDVILTLMLPPLLFSAASEFSLVSFIRRLGSIVNLGVLLVVVTTAVVGVIAFLLVPALTLPGAMVLAAVVSPPDAVTAVAIGSKLGLPERVMTVIKGESLINDAAALTLFTFAAASVTGAHLFISNLVPYLLYSAVAGILVGAVLGTVVHRIRLKLGNASLSTVLSVLVPFTAYVVAEEISASGVLAVVAAGFLLGHNARVAQYDARIQERQFWHTTDALLETFIFAYIGLQFRFVVEDAARTGTDLVYLAAVSIAILAAMIVVRLAWIFLTGALAAWRYPHLEAMRKRLPANDRRLRRDIYPPFGWRENLVLGWTGMRGVVTLAAAAGIPLTTVGGASFPGRDIAVIVAFVVTIGTLLLQGITLPAMIRWLDISDPADSKRREAQTRLAHEVMRGAMAAAVAAARDALPEGSERNAADKMLTRFRRSEAVEPASGDSGAAMLKLTQQALAARRSALVEARDERRIDDDVMREELEKMDLEEAVIANWTPDRFGR